jgi:hypothetical protein
MIDIKGKSVQELRELNWRRMLPRLEIPEYIAWKAMKQRCYDPNFIHYRYYGGRGITVCEEWRTDFWAWFEGGRSIEDSQSPLSEPDWPATVEPRYGGQ